MEIFKIVILSLSALLLLIVGISRLSNPIKAYSKNSGIKIENEVNILNEMRGVSALMLSGGALVTLGIFFPSFTFTSFVVGTLIFLGFLIGRLISMAIDGKPNKQITQGIIFEFVLGAANIFGLLNNLV